MRQQSNLMPPPPALQPTLQAPIGKRFDPTRENPITLSAAAALPELQRNGKKLHISQLYRWATIGSRGIVLESLVVGGVRVTSRESVRRFIQACTNRAGPVVEVPAGTAHERAEAELAAKGL